MNQALRLQEERAMRPGRGSHQYWYVDSACSLVGIKFEPSRTDALRRQAVDRVSRLLYRILSLQDDPSENYLASEVSDFMPFPCFPIYSSNQSIKHPAGSEQRTNYGSRSCSAKTSLSRRTVESMRRRVVSWIPNHFRMQTRPSASMDWTLQNLLSGC